MLVTKCPECGQENEEGATVCVTCDSSLDIDDYEPDDDDIYDEDWDDEDWDEDDFIEEEEEDE